MKLINKINKMILSISLLYLCGLLFGCVHNLSIKTPVTPVAPKTKVVATPSPKEIVTSPEIGNIATELPLTFKLENGMTVILKERHDSPVVALQAWIKTGSIYEDKYLGSGISHAVEHMLFKNTKNRGIGEIAQEIHNAGGKLNGYTTWDHTVFHLVVASRYFDNGLDVLGDALMNSLMDEGEWQKEQQVILREISMNEDEPNRFMYKKFWNILFEKHPFRYPVIGERELFKKLTIEDVRDYYVSRFVPNNIILVAVGDFDSAKTLDKIRETFKDFTPRSLPYVYISPEPRQIASREVVIEKDVKVARLNVGFHTIDIRHPDLYALDVMAMILGQGRPSRLYQNVKEKGLVHSINSWSYTPGEPGVFGISARLEEENRPKAQEAILKEIERFKTEQVTSLELQRAKQKVLSDYYFSGQTVQGMARQITSDYYLTGELDFSRRYVDGINKVTAAQIEEIANRYFYPENRTIIFMKAPSKKVDSLETAVAAKGFSFKGSFKKLTLKNGITLLVRENFSAPIVSVQTFMLGGVRFEEDFQNGISSFMQSMLKRGTKNRSADQLAEELEMMGASLGTSSGYNSCYNQLSVLSKDLAKGVELLADVVKHPTFPTEEIEKLRSDILASIKQQDEAIFSVASKLYRETYFTDHPYRFRTMGSKETVEKISRDDLIKFAKKIYNPKRITIVVVGAVKTEEALRVVKKNFSDIGESSLVEVAWKPQQPPSEAQEAAKYLPGKEQAILMLGFPSTDLKHPDNYVYEVMSAFLSGQGNRLFQELRDKRGLAYYVGTFNITGLEPGSYVFYIGTTADKVAESEAGFWAEIERLKKEPVPPEELSRAKRTLIGQKEINIQTNSAQAFSVGLDEIYGMGYDHLDKYAAAIEKVTAADILRVARENFLKENSVKIVVQPPKEEQKQE